MRPISARKVLARELWAPWRKDEVLVDAILQDRFTRKEYVRVIWKNSKDVIWYPTWWLKSKQCEGAVEEFAATFRCKQRKASTKTNHRYNLRSHQ